MHAADARLKFLVAVGFILSVSLLPPGSYVALGIAWLGVAGTSIVAHLGPVRPARRALIAAPFLLAALPLVVTRTAEPIGTIVIGSLPITISGEGLRMFTTIALKSWISVQAALVLAFTTPFHELVDALRQLRLPPIMVAIIGFMYRYLGVLAGEATRMSRARAARSAAPRGGAGGRSVAWRARVTGAMVGTLFLRSYERSERIYAAMQARGFQGEFRHLHARALRAPEIALLAGTALLLAAYVVVAVAWLPHG